MQICFRSGLDGRKTDMCVQADGGNHVRANRPVLPVDMGSLEELVVMLRDADYPHAFIEDGVFHYNALYKVDSVVPVRRIYFIKTRDLVHAAEIWGSLRQRGIDLPLVDSEQFGKLIEADSYEERYRHWLAIRKQRTRNIERLFEGRRETLS
jgi:hypothetical protein